MESFKFILLVTIAAAYFITTASAACSNVKSMTDVTLGSLNTGRWYLVNASKSAAVLKKACFYVDFLNNSQIDVHINKKNWKIPFNGELNQTQVKVDKTVLGVAIKTNVRFKSDFCSYKKFNKQKKFNFFFISF